MLILLVGSSDNLKDALHYLKVEAEGKLRAKFEKVEIPFSVEKKDRLIHCNAQLTNLGTETWGEERKHYIALGLFERDEKGKRQVSEVKLLDLKMKKTQVANGDRIIIAEKTLVKTNGKWNIEFYFEFPATHRPGQAYSLHLQMVKEGITWFGPIYGFKLEVT